MTLFAKIMKYELIHRTKKELSNGKFYPLGAALKEDGVNFAIYSRQARAVYLLLFNARQERPSDIIKLRCRTRNIWHVFVHGIRAGQLYAYKVDGDYCPERGLRFNANKLLLDPYAKALTDKIVNRDDLLLGYDALSAQKDLSFDPRDNTAIVPKCIVIDDNDFDWQNDVHPDIPPSETIIYEVHVKGFTAHPSSKVKQPGTYLGFVEKIPYLKDLGITAVELLPVHEFYPGDFLLNKELTEYWGYNTVCYYAPEISYGTHRKPGCQVNEFKTLVRELHQAGIEVILDVVFNHTFEGTELGPTVCYRGIDNSTYYYLSGPENEPKRCYTDYTGCGNSLNAENAPVLRLITDSLRYWVEVMHVDGFRFDLASVLGRKGGDFVKTASFFDAVSQDPVLSRIKLIAEPWDIGTYQVGNFPVDWAEWNGKFRDTMRKFCKGDGGQLADFSARIFGSRDIYKKEGRNAYHSINFVTCHDGFTLNDLVSYYHKHNEANGENNTDGADDNNSWNWGVEGPTADADITALRKQLIKNFICCLLFAGGTPMICGGDEFGRSQAGNNNAYCQDNKINWFDWTLLDKNREIYNFFKILIHLLTRHKLIQKHKIRYGNVLPPDVEWYNCNLDSPDWNNHEEKTICFSLKALEADSENIHYFFIFNSDWVPKKIKLPAPGGKNKWYRIVDTSRKSPEDIVDPWKRKIVLKKQDYYPANPRSVILLAN